MVKIFTKAVIAGALFVGIVQADLIHELHDTQAWQSLGYEKSNDGIPSKANGISVKNDEGDWELLTNDFSVEVGTNVEFQVEMYKENYGIHQFDALKLWLDDGTDDLFVTQETFDNIWTQKDAFAGTYQYFNFDYKFDDAGDFNLTARVTCSQSLSRAVEDEWERKTWYGFNIDNATDADWAAWDKNDPWLYQGEKEVYKLSVTENVPEPATLSLLGFGLLGLAFIRRKK